MKELFAVALIAMTTSVVLAEGGGSSPSRVVMEPDFGLALDTPDGFSADVVGQTDDGYVMITVSEVIPRLTPLDDDGSICEIVFKYDPNFGQGDQAWVNSLADETDFYSRMAEQVAVPGAIESNEDFTHNGSSSHRFEGRHDIGGSFLVAAIPTTQGFALMTCASREPDQNWDNVQPVLDAIVVPGQPRDRLQVSGTCNADQSALPGLLETKELDRQAIERLDATWNELTLSCGPLHADDIMNAALIEAGFAQSYRETRYTALAEVGANLLTAEQTAALDEAREQVRAATDGATAERYIRYMHFIVGLRSQN